MLCHGLVLSGTPIRRLFHAQSGNRACPLTSSSLQTKSDNQLLKSLGLLRTGNEVIHDVVTELAKEAPIKQVFQALDISRSGYYAARRRASVPAPICQDSVHDQAVFLASGRTYGSRRLSAALRVQGHDIGRHRCRTLMKACGLKVCWRRKFVHTIL